MPAVQPADGALGRGRRGRRPASTLSEINVVPLVDVMLVLLIIFMVTAPMIQRGVEVKLPVARTANTISGERLFVTVPATYGKTKRVFFGDEEIRADALTERSRQRMETATDKNVYLRADGSILHQDVIDVMDRLKAGGVTNVVIVTAPAKREP